MRRMAAIGLAVAVIVTGMAVIKYVVIAPKRPEPETDSTAPERERKTQVADAGPTVVRIRWPADAAPIDTPRAPDLELKAVEKVGNWNNVYARKPEGAWVNLTNFKRPQHLYDFKASPDGQWVYVWHEAYPPRELSVYEVATGRRVGNFEPGLAGNMGWVVRNRIYHECCFSTGAGCRYYLYDVHGNTVREGYSLCPYASPSGRFLVTCSNHPLADEPLVIRDLADWRVLCSHDLAEERVCVQELAWASDRRLNVTDSTGRQWLFIIEAE